ncbi:MAG: glycine cleavage system protein H, partial [Rhodospirillales bacterium]|nr:glycine cleavage system protein H [Rhodospirillales bacterium]
MAIYYTEDHEWIHVEDGKARVGITAHAAEQLGEVVYVELKE